MWNKVARWNRRALLTGATVAVLLALAAGYLAGVTISRASGQLLCTANPCKITMTRNGAAGLIIKDAAGPQVENPLLIVDPSGLAEFWQNAAGAYEGPKGEICTTGRALAPVACLGSDGTTGWVSIHGEVLTASDIAWLHRAEQAAARAAARAARRADHPPSRPGRPPRHAASRSHGPLWHGGNCDT